MPLATRSMPIPKQTSSKQCCDGCITTYHATPGVAYLGGVYCEHFCHLLPDDRTNITAFLELHQLRYEGHKEDTVATSTIGT